jgi:phosphohistidine phosphatase
VDNEDKEYSLDLILWRHADAEDGFPDHGRVLTEKGRKQAATVAKWLQRRLPDGVRVIASPAVRAQQTADALGRPYETMPGIAPGTDATALLHAAGWPDSKGCVVLVAHQPAMGRLASLLLCGQENDLSIKKAGIWWFTNRVRRDEQQIVLKVVMAPEMV